LSNAPATSDISSRSLHDALPIYRLLRSRSVCPTHGAVTDGRYSSNAHDTRPPRRATSTPPPGAAALGLVLLCEALDDLGDPHFEDRKSTRLNSSHVKISYAVFCL